MRLLTNKIHVEAIPTEDKTTEGIFRVSSENYSSASKGKVLNIGPDVADVAVGDTIYYTPSAGFKVPNTEERIIDLNNVLAVL